MQVLPDHASFFRLSGALHHSLGKHRGLMAMLVAWVCHQRMPAKCAEALQA